MEVRVGVGEWSQESVRRGQESGVSTQGSGVGVRSWSWRMVGVRGQESAVERRFERGDSAYPPRAPQIFLVGARLRTRPLTPCRPYETDASERRPYQHHLVGARLRTRPYYRTPWKGVPTTADDYSGNAILTVVPSPILLEIVIFPPSSAVRRSMPESP